MIPYGKEYGTAILYNDWYLRQRVLTVWLKLFKRFRGAPKTQTPMKRQTTYDDGLLFIWHLMQ